MNTIKKLKNSYSGLLLVMATVFALTACKKEEPAKYSGDNFVYFMNQAVLNPNSATVRNFYKDVVEFSYLTPLNQVESMVFNKPGSGSFPLLLQADGRISSENRKVIVQVEGDGQEYCILPHPDSIFIPANEIQFSLNMELVRPPLTDTSTKTITLYLRNSDDFSPESHVWNKVTYKFGNLFVLPQFYVQIEPVYGEYSPAKLYAIYEAVHRKGVDYWKDDADVIALNTWLTSRNQILVGFEPFTLLDLYYFLNLVNYARTWARAGTPQRIAFDSLTNRIIALTKELMIERKNAGTPIVDASGAEISFP
ncbi:hypothetical protein [Sphingobacterium lumbrici]|uniref:hypothetical protein n=1 Tax=Sphingobacterium lumbrici TaxID=2559600 RepID=UPI00112805F4|nr:hypothetical protein [Sphingobacterium lumbrici]